MLYTRHNPFKAKYLYMNDERHLLKSNFNFNYPLAIYLHGFSESAISDKQSSQQIKNAFLKMGNYNVLLIDWSPLTTIPWYSNSVENMPIVGHYIAQFIRFLLYHGYPRNKIHLIGFSLGAALAGMVGKQLQQWGILLQRITGLDPALPLFEMGSPNRHLQITDARFVDVIHTDGGLLGNPEPMGHADFYPNDGHGIQPGCARQEIANNRWLGILIGCSHQRAWEYFIESIRYPLAFPATTCEPSKVAGKCQYDINGQAFMGMGANTRLRGRFYLNTNDEPPYGRQITLGQSRRPFTSAALMDLTQLYNKNNVLTTAATTTAAATATTTATATATTITTIPIKIMPTAKAMAITRTFDTMINVTGIRTTTTAAPATTTAPATATAITLTTTTPTPMAIPVATSALTTTRNDTLEKSKKLEQQQWQQQQQQQQQQSQQQLQNDITKFYRTITVAYNNNNNSNNNNNNIVGIIVADNILWNIIQLPTQREMLQET